MIKGLQKTKDKRRKTRGDNFALGLKKKKKRKKTRLK